jgi:polysaccharide deacetylase 2 family uncharacterized protein YibQ
VALADSINLSKLTNVANHLKEKLFVLGFVIDKIMALVVILKSTFIWLTENFSVRSFMIGLVLIVIFFAGVSVWITISSGKFEEYKKSKLSSHMVVVERKKRTTASNDVIEKIQDILSKEYLPQHEMIKKYNLEKMASGLFAAPIKGLKENTPDGIMPSRRKDGLTPFAAYRRHFNLHLVDAPVISLGIMNLGLSSAATEKAIKTMPPEISIVLSPYSLNPKLWVDESRANGHEVWLSMPTETDNYPLHDPGPHTLLIGATEKENAAKFSWVMSRVDGYIGFVTEPNQNFIKSTNDMRPIVSKVYDRGLAFIDGSADPSLIPQNMAHQVNAPYAAIDVWIDSSPNNDDILKQLKKLEKIAKSRGMAAGMINAYPLSYQAIRNWMATLPQRGFVVAPLSAQTGL